MNEEETNEALRKQINEAITREVAAVAFRSAEQLLEHRDEGASVSALAEWYDESITSLRVRIFNEVCRVIGVYRAW